jgi:hypothetical protein
MLFPTRTATSPLLHRHAGISELTQAPSINIFIKTLNHPAHV